MLFACATLLAGSARAFTEPRTYYDSATNGGGGGRFFTGSPAEGYSCTVCHTGPAKVWPIQITGLPESGYVPGEQYDLTLRWPELADHAEQLREDNDVPPAMSVVVELVAESGVGAGKLELSAPADADEDELCLVPPGKIAAQLYSVKPDEAAKQSGTLCVAEKLGQRCVATTLSCGPRALRMRWTAPEDAQGPIWLAGGMVATDEASGDAKDDNVNTFKRVMLPVGSSAEHAVSRLRSGCSAAGAIRAGDDWARGRCALIALGALALLLARRQRGLRTALAALALGACNASPEVPFGAGDHERHPTAGLYTPGSLIGAVPIDRDAAADASGNPLEDLIGEAMGTDRCVERESEGTPGELVATFFSASYGGFYAPENVGVVWIEDTEGQFVATALLWAGVRTGNLWVWDARRCNLDHPDVISGATQVDHRELRQATWDGKDHTGRVVPDGMYVLNIEITEDEFDYGTLAMVPFEKGASAQMLQPEDSESVKDLKLIYTPAP
jgi:hypothetical protein